MSRLSQTLRVTGLTLIVVLTVGLIRYLGSGPPDLENLEQFEIASGLDVGPDTAWFASGLAGDGAVFAIMTADPLGQAEGAAIFDPGYRYSRVGYSWLAWVFSLGQEGSVLLGLSVVGLLAIAGITVMALREHERLGWRAWLLLANPALLIGFLYDTAEPLALALLILTLRTGWVVPGLGLAMVRESYLTALAGNLRVFAAGIAAALGFRLVWALHFGDSFFAGTANFSLPFVGFARSPTLVGGLVLAAGVATLIAGIPARNLAWVISGLLVICLSDFVYSDPINAVRAAGILPVLWAFGPEYQMPRPFLAWRRRIARTT